MTKILLQDVEAVHRSHPRTYSIPRSEQRLNLKVGQLVQLVFLVDPQTSGGATGERMMVSLMTFKRGQEVGSHSHPHEQAGYCVSGRFELTIGDQTAEIGPDDSYVIPGGATHGYRVIEDFDEALVETGGDRSQCRR